MKSSVLKNQLCSDFSKCFHFYKNKTRSLFFLLKLQNQQRFVAFLSFFHLEIFELLFSFGTGQTAEFRIEIQTADLIKSCMTL